MSEFTKNLSVFLLCFLVSAIGMMMLVPWSRPHILSIPSTILTTEIGRTFLFLAILLIGGIIVIKRVFE